MICPKGSVGVVAIVVVGRCCNEMEEKKKAAISWCEAIKEKKKASKSWLKEYKTTDGGLKGLSERTKFRRERWFE